MQLHGQTLNSFNLARNVLTYILIECQKHWYVYHRQFLFSPFSQRSVKKVVCISGASWMINQLKLVYMLIDI